MKGLLLFGALAASFCFGQQAAQTAPPPEQQTTQPAPDSSQAAPSTAQPATDTGQPTPSAVMPTPDAGQPAPNPAQPAPDSSQAAPDAAQPAAGAAQPPAPEVSLVPPSTTPPSAGQLPPGQKPSTDGFGIKDQTFVIDLLSPLSTKTAKPGDTFTASVSSPPQFVGAIIEGRINNMKKPKKGAGKGNASVEFEFDTMTFHGKTSTMTMQLTDIANSKGVKNVDDEGRAIGRTSQKKRVGMAFGGAALGALAGYALGGASGAMIGAGVGAVAGLAIGMTMTTSGSDIEFRPGSKFTLTVTDPPQPKKKKL